MITSLCARILLSTKEDKKMKNHTVPLNPANFPQQKIYAINKITPLPLGCEVQLLDYVEDHNLAGIPNKPNKQSIPLGQVEWAWGPMHARVDAYEIHKGKTHWLLWSGGPEDNSGRYIKNWFACAIVPCDEVNQEQAATHLLLKFWEREIKWRNLDRYHWINHAIELSVSQFQSIADALWEER